MRRVCSVLTFALIVLSAMGFVLLSKHKPFWLDEAYELVWNYSTSAWKMLFFGAPAQCSPAPIYYILQRNVLLLLNSTGGFGEAILWQLRLVSIVSAVGVLALFYRLCLPVLGAAPSFFGCSLLAAHFLFADYAVETRAYMVWMFFYAWALYSAMRFETRKGAWKFADLGLAIFGLTATASPGMLQSAGFILCLLAFNALEKKKTQWSLVSLMLGSLCLGSYYAWDGCNLLGKGFSLQDVKGVVRVLFPKGIEEWPVHSLVLLGMAAPLLHKKRQWHWKKLSLQISAQILMAGVLMGIVILDGYYLNQRGFLFLAICRAALSALGAAMVLDLLAQAYPTLKPVVASCLVVCGGVVWGYRLYPFLRLDPGGIYRTSVYDQLPCDRWVGRFNLIFPNTVTPIEERINAIARLSVELKRCGWQKEGPLRYAWVTTTAPQSGWVKILDSPPPEFEDVRILGKAVSFY